MATQLFKAFYKVELKRVKLDFYSVSALRPSSNQCAWSSSRSRSRAFYDKTLIKLGVIRMNPGVGDALQFCDCLLLMINSLGLFVCCYFSATTPNWTQSSCYFYFVSLLLMHFTLAQFSHHRASQEKKKNTLEFSCFAWYDKNVLLYLKIENWLQIFNTEWFTYNIKYCEFYRRHFELIKCTLDFSYH